MYLFVLVKLLLKPGIAELWEKCRLFAKLMLLLSCMRARAQSLSLSLLYNMNYSQPLSLPAPDFSSSWTCPPWLGYTLRASHLCNYPNPRWCLLASPLLWLPFMIPCLLTSITSQGQGKRHLHFSFTGTSRQHCTRIKEKKPVYWFLS